MTDPNAERQVAAEQGRASVKPAGRLLPQLPQSEQALLSCFYHSPREVGAICVEKCVTSDHFHAPAHALIFRAMMEMWNDGKHIDFILVTNYLRDRNRLEEAGGAAFITQLSEFVPSAVNVRLYIDELEEKRTLRRIIEISDEYGRKSFFEQDRCNELLDEFEAAALSVKAKRGVTLRSVKELVMKSMAYIQDAYDAKGKLLGISTGFADLDKMTDGLHGEDMIVIAARPSMGKTALCMNMAEHMAIDQQRPVGVLSLEMSDQQLMNRLLSSRARVNLKQIRYGFLSERDFPKLNRAAAEIAASPLYIQDMSSPTIQQVKSAGRLLVQKYGIQALFIDYLQLIRPSTMRKKYSRNDEVSEISGETKGLAKELKIPVVVLAQLNRGPEGRLSKRPILADLRDSGAIEQDADVVGLLTREEYYAGDEETKRQCEGKAKLIVAKQRTGFGETGDVDLTFIKEFVRFESRAVEPEAEQLDLVNQELQSTRKR